MSHLARGDTRGLTLKKQEAFASQIAADIRANPASVHAGLNGGVARTTHALLKRPLEMAKISSHAPFNKGDIPN